MWNKYSYIGVPPLPPTPRPSRAHQDFGGSKINQKLISKMISQFFIFWSTNCPKIDSKINQNRWINHLLIRLLFFSICLSFIDQHCASEFSKIMPKPFVLLYKQLRSLFRFQGIWDTKLFPKSIQNRFQIHRKSTPNWHRKLFSF